MIATLTKDARSLRRWLEAALLHIEHELYAAGPDEVRQHPMLRSKDEFVRRTRKKLRALDNEKAVR